MGVSCCLGRFGLRGVGGVQAMTKLREKLPKDAVLVGQNIGKDVEWLGLREGVSDACAHPPSSAC